MALNTNIYLVLALVKKNFHVFNGDDAQRTKTLLVFILKIWFDVNTNIYSGTGHVKKPTIMLRFVLKTDRETGLTLTFEAVRMLLLLKLVVQALIQL